MPFFHAEAPTDKFTQMSAYLSGYFMGSIIRMQTLLNYGIPIRRVNKNGGIFYTTQTGCGLLAMPTRSVPAGIQRTPVFFNTLGSSLREA